MGVFIRMAEARSGVHHFLLLRFFASISLVSTQSVPPFYAGSYIESYDGQGGPVGGFYYGPPPQHFYYADSDNTITYYGSSPYQGEAKIVGDHFHLQKESQSEEIFSPLELVKGLANTFNNLVLGFNLADDKQDGGDGGGGGGEGGGGGNGPLIINDGNLVPAGNPLIIPDDDGGGGGGGGGLGLGLLLGLGAASAGAIGLGVLAGAGGAGVIAVVANNMDVISKLWDHVKEKIFDLIGIAADVINDNGGEFITNAVIDVSIIIGQMASDVYSTIEEIVRILLDLTDSVVINDVPANEENDEDNDGNDGNDGNGSDNNDSSEGNNDDSGNNNNNDDNNSDGDASNDDSNGNNDNSGSNDDSSNAGDADNTPDRIAMQAVGTIAAHGARMAAGFVVTAIVALAARTAVELLVSANAGGGGLLASDAFLRREELEYVNSNVAGEQILGGGYHHVINPSSVNDIYGTGDYDQLAAGIDNYAENPYHLYSLVDDRNLGDSNVKGFANGGGV